MRHFCVFIKLILGFLGTIHDTEVSNSCSTLDLTRTVSWVLWAELKSHPTHTQQKLCVLRKNE